MKRLAALIALSAYLSCQAAEVIPVAPVEDCFLCSSAPSLTMYWPGHNSKVVLIIIPGGDGYIGLKSDTKDVTRPYYENLKRLTNPEYTRGQVDLVLLDSPSVITPDEGNLGGRATKDHMIRIASVAKFYKQKTGLPVWVLGQSNGGVSLANFIRYLQDKDDANLLAGGIASTTRPETNFSSTMNLPLLFITHRLDGCRYLPQIHSLYERAKEANKSETEWVVAETGEAQAGLNPCGSGFHMFYKAGEEYAKAIDDFIAAHP